MLEDLRNKIIEQERASSQQHDKKIKANKNNIGAYYISNQHHSLTLTPSKVYSKVSFTEHSFFPRKKFLIDIFVRNGYKKKLLKNLVVECNNKKNNKHNHENNTQTRDYTNLKRLPWILNISPKIKREFKKIGKALPSRRGKICSEFSAKRISQNYYQIVNQEYTSQIACVMENILAN